MRLLREGWSGQRVGRARVLAAVDNRAPVVGIEHVPHVFHPKLEHLLAFVIASEPNVQVLAAT